jgi:isoleucyl-tRNA synthetase
MSTPVMNADNFNFSDKGIDEVYKKILVLLYNVNNFYELYKNVKPAKSINSDNVMDKWILSRVEETNNLVNENFKKYNTIKACEAIRIFIDDLSTWYVRRSRDRFSEDDADAKAVLGYVLEKTALIIAPVLPFVSEIIYHSVVDAKTSVHLQKFPEFNKKLINTKINEHMAKVREVVSITLKERDRVRMSLPKEYLKIIEEEVNVKKVELKKEKVDSISIKLDIELTPELEAEGLAREISRKVQALRKTTGLVKEDFIDLSLVLPKGFIELLEKYNQVEMLKERTNAKKIELVLERGKKKYAAELKEKLKEQDIEVYLNKI